MEDLARTASEGRRRPAGAGVAEERRAAVLEQAAAAENVEAAQESTAQEAHVKSRHSENFLANTAQKETKRNRAVYVLGDELIRQLNSTTLFADATMRKPLVGSTHQDPRKPPKSGPQKPGPPGGGPQPAGPPPGGPHPGPPGPRGPISTSGSCLTTAAQELGLSTNFCSEYAVECMN